MEQMNDNHSIEIKVYQQKIKHLQFDHEQTMKQLHEQEIEESKEETDLHLKKEAYLRSEKNLNRQKIREMEENNANIIKTMKLLQEKNASKLKQEFRQTLDNMKNKFEARLATLKADLTLRHKVEVHEVEERKHTHINQLTAAHEQAFTEIKKYYNDITKANLDLINTLKAQIAEANEKSTANQKLMLEIAEENKRLSDPLQKATVELHSLQNDLKDAEKDRQSLQYAKTRLRNVRAQLAALENTHAELERKYAQVEAERDELYNKFEGTVRAAQHRSESRNEALEKRLGEAEAEYTARRMQVNAVVSAASLDPHMLIDIQNKLDNTLDQRNIIIKDLHSGITKLTKAHNDAIRTFTARMQELGMPKDFIESLPLQPLPGNLSSGPGGLIAKESK